MTKIDPKRPKIIDTPETSKTLDFFWVLHREELQRLRGKDEDDLLESIFESGAERAKVWLDDLLVLLLSDSCRYPLLAVARIQQYVNTWQ